MSSAPAALVSLGGMALLAFAAHDGHTWTAVVGALIALAGALEVVS